MPCLPSLMMTLLFAKNKKKRSTNCEGSWNRFESGMKIKSNSPAPKLIFFFSVLSRSPCQQVHLGPCRRHPSRQARQKWHLTLTPVKLNWSRYCQDEDHIWQCWCYQGGHATSRHLMSWLCLARGSTWSVLRMLHLMFGR